jgi:hypothetical protein
MSSRRRNFERGLALLIILNIHIGAMLKQYPPLPKVTHEMPTEWRDGAITLARSSSPPLILTSSPTGGEHDMLGAPEERHRGLMGENASTKGRVSAMATGSLGVHTMHAV